MHSNRSKMDMPGEQEQNDHARGRTWNLLIRSQAPCHWATQPIYELCLARTVHDSLLSSALDVRNDLSASNNTDKVWHGGLMFEDLRQRGRQRWFANLTTVWEGLSGIDVEAFLDK
jgi:hypothetical protein